MRKILWLLSLLILWFVLSIACRNTNQAIVGPAQLFINSAINLTSFERLDPLGATFEFRCLTDSIYPCANYNVGFLLDTLADTLNLEFTEIFRPSVCVPPDGPAFSLINLGDVANAAYQFRITVDGVVASAIITVTDSTIIISGGDSTWTNFPRPVLRRIPDNIIWGQVGYSLANAFDSAYSFFDSLASIGAVAETLSGGSYGYFYFDNAGNPDSILELGPSIGTTFRIPYVYHYTGDTVALCSLITAYATQDNVVEINVITSQGFEYRTW